MNPQRKLSAIKWLWMQSRNFRWQIVMILVAGSLLSLAGIGLAVLSRQMIDSAVDGRMDLALRAGGWLAGVILLQMALGSLHSLWLVRTSAKMLNTLQANLYRDISRGQWMEVSKYHSGDLMTRLTSDAQVVANHLVQTVPDIVSMGVRLVAAFVVLYIFEPMLAVMSFVLVAVALMMNRIFGRKLKQLHLRVQESESTCRGLLQEFIQHWIVIKSFGQEKNTRSSIEAAHQERLRWTMSRSFLGIFSRSLLGLGYWSGYFLAFYWGVLGLYRGSISFGTMAAFLQLVGQVQGPVISLAYTYPQIIATLASADRLIQLHTLAREQETDDMLELPEAGVKVEGISFAYAEDQPVLKDWSLSVAPGEIVAITGASGEGKTTFFQLLLALLQPQEGKIVLTDGKGGSWEASALTRSLFSYVPQGNTLFSGTIGENIRWGKPEATNDELKQAAICSDAWEFIAKMPQGLDTLIGERGVGLSEGQAQRIAIARAILREAPILLLDEASSALDEESERKVLAAIKALVPARTCIIITHRKTAFSICDQVCHLTPP